MSDALTDRRSEPDGYIRSPHAAAAISEIDRRKPGVVFTCTDDHAPGSGGGACAKCAALVTKKPVDAAPYPDDNPKTIFGLMKLKFSVVPPAGIVHLMRAMMDGARKYGPLNWRTKKVTASIYYDAAMRHMMAWYDGQDDAEDSGVNHLGHAMACLAIILDAKETGNLNDDRPPPGNFAQLLKAFEKPMTQAA